MSLPGVDNKAQGRYVRWTVFCLAMAGVLVGAKVLGGALARFGAAAAYGVPAGAIVLAALLLAWLVKRPALDRFFGTLLTPHKKGQGRYARWITFWGVMVVVLAGAKVLSDKLAVYVGPAVQFGVPAGLVILAGLFMYWLVNRPKTADFLIATEGEMKKVSWSSRKEIVGSTKVVIVATLILGAILYAVDIVFAVMFKWLGVM